MAQRSRSSGRIIIYIALILILLAVGAYILLKGHLLTTTNQQPPANTTPIVQQEPMVDIVITTQAVPRGSVFNSDVLTTIKYPQKNFVTGLFYNKVSDVIGKVAKVDLGAQVPLTSNLVVENGSLNAEQIPAGMVAISVPLKDRISAISYAPQIGDHVNVIAAITFVDLDSGFQTILPDKVGQVTSPGATASTVTACVTTDGKIAPPLECEDNTQGTTVLDPSLQQPVYVFPGEPQRPRLVSQTLIQDAIVLGVGNFIQPSEVTQPTSPTATPLANATPVATPATKTVYPDTITLIVAPQDAVTLNYLIYAGADLTLVLRGTGDAQRIQTEAVTLQYLMDQYNIPLPAKLPYGTDPRTDNATPVNPLQLDPRYNIPSTAVTPVP